MNMATKEYTRNWIKSNPDKVKEYRKRSKNKYLNDKEYRDSVTIKRKQCRKKNQLKLKNEVLSYYSKNKAPECIVCGFNDIRALSIDHMENNGANHRRELGNKTLSGYHFYRWLKKNNFPLGYQCLCMNCQWEKR